MKKTYYVKLADRTPEQQQAHKDAKAARKAENITQKGRPRQYKFLVSFFYLIERKK